MQNRAWSYQASDGHRFQGPALSQSQSRSQSQLSPVILTHARLADTEPRHSEAWPATTHDRRILPRFTISQSPPRSKEIARGTLLVDATYSVVVFRRPPTPRLRLRLPLVYFFTSAPNQLHAFYLPYLRAPLSNASNSSQLLHSNHREVPPAHHTTTPTRHSAPRLSPNPSVPSYSTVWIPAQPPGPRRGPNRCVLCRRAQSSSHGVSQRLGPIHTTCLERGPSTFGSLLSHQPTTSSQPCRPENLVHPASTPAKFVTPPPARRISREQGGRWRL